MRAAGQSKRAHRRFALSQARREDLLWGIGVSTPQPFWHGSARVYITPLYAKFPLVRAVESTRSPRWRSSLAQEFGGGFGIAALLQKLHGALGPNRPVAEEAADDAALFSGEAVGGKKVGDDVVVVAGVEGDVIGV